MNLPLYIKCVKKVVFLLFSLNETSKKRKIKETRDEPNNVDCFMIM